MNEWNEGTTTITQKTTENRKQNNDFEVDEYWINIEQGFLLLKLILSSNSRCPIASQISIALRLLNFLFHI